VAIRELSSGTAESLPIDSVVNLNFLSVWKGDHSVAVLSASSRLPGFSPGIGFRVNCSRHGGNGVTLHAPYPGSFPLKVQFRKPFRPELR